MIKREFECFKWLQKQLIVITRECTGFYFVLKVNSVDLEQCKSICFELFYFDSHSWVCKYGVSVDYATVKAK